MEKECCVCLEGKWLITTPCHHLICLGCLIKLQKDSCPICRANLKDKLPEDVKNFFGIKSQNRLNIYDNNEFPELSSHPFS